MKQIRKGIMLTAVALLSGMMIAGTADAKVKKTSLATAKVKLQTTSYTYNGKARKPKVTSVKLNKVTIKKKNYTVTYSKNKNAGTAKVTIKAKPTSKLYKGKVVKTFTIKKASRGLTPGELTYNKVVGDGTFYVSAKPTKGEGTLSYTCDTTDVIKVTKKGNVTILKEGTAVIVATVSADTNYKKATTTMSVVVVPKDEASKYAVDSEASIKNFDYDSAINRMRSNQILTFAGTVPFSKLVEQNYNVLSQYKLVGLAPTFQSDFDNGYTLCTNMCPQGFCFVEDYLLVSEYCMDSETESEDSAATATTTKHPSCIFVYDKKTGDYLQTLELDSVSHVGGVTYDGTNIWVSEPSHTGMKGYFLQKFTYAALKKYVAGTKKTVKMQEVELKSVGGKPSSLTYNKIDGYLWLPENISYGDARDKGKVAYLRAFEYKDNELKEAQRQCTSNEYLGVQVETVTEDSEVGKRVQAVSGAAVTVVPKETMAADVAIEDDNVEDTKLKMGDVITYLDGKLVKNKEDLFDILSEKKYEQDESGQDVTPQIPITVLRYTEGAEVPVQKIEGLLDPLKVGTVNIVRALPNRVQGMSFSEDGTKVTFSRSAGPIITLERFISALALYQWDDYDYDTDTWNPIAAISLPPMVEQVNLENGAFTVIFESAAKSYLDGTANGYKSDCPVDRLVSFGVPDSWK